MEGEVKVKVKFNLEQATKTQRGIRGIDFHFNLSAGRSVWSMPRLGHFTPEKDSVPLVQETGRAPFWSGRERKS